MLDLLRNKLPFLKGNITVLAFRQITGQICRNMVFPYASLLILAVGGNSSQVGIVNSLRPLAGLIVFPIAGYLTDRKGRVKLMAYSGYLSAFSILLYVFSPSWHWIALGALLQGFAVIEFPPSSAILAENLEPRYRGVGIATMTGLASLFALASPYIAALIVTSLGDERGVRTLYAIYMTSFIINTFVLRYFKDAEPKEAPEDRINLLNILKQVYSNLPTLIKDMPTSVRALSVVSGMSFIANSLTSPFWVVYVTDIIGIEKVEWGLILLIESLMRVGFIIPAGMIVDRYGRSKSLMTAIIISLVSFPSLTLASSFAHVLLIRLCVAIAVSLYVPASAALMADYVPREMRGRIMSAVGRGSTLIGSTGGGVGGPGMGYFFVLPVMVGSILGGLLYSINPVYPWIGVLLTCLVQLVCVFFFIHDPIEKEI
jgi:MFS family permease